jgi:hypothetical protein
MRFDVFEKLSPGFFGKRRKGRSVSKPERVPEVRPDPMKRHMCYVVTEDAVNVDQALGGSSLHAFRCLDRHARWLSVHEMTHSTRTQ